ncbi:MAG: hypothetical protein ACRBBW_21355 [Cellvibrionaceae bacterium]
MSTFTLVLGQGEVGTLPSGASFQILSATNNVDVEFVYNGQIKNRAKNVPASYYYRPRDSRLDGSGIAFTQVRVIATYGAVVITADVSDADSGTSILAGEVTVNGIVKVDPLATEESPAFSAYGNSGNALGEYSYRGVMNPAGSGKKIVVWQMHCGASENSGGVIQLYRAGQLAAEGLSGYSYGALLGHQVSQQVALARNWWARSASNVGGHYMAFIQSLQSDFVYRPNRPVVLDEGDVLFLRSISPNVDLYVNIEIEEVANV